MLRRVIRRGFRSKHQAPSGAALHIERMLNANAGFPAGICVSGTGDENRADLSPALAQRQASFTRTGTLLRVAFEYGHI